MPLIYPRQYFTHCTFYTVHVDKYSPSLDDDNSDDDNNSDHSDDVDDSDHSPVAPQNT